MSTVALSFRDVSKVYPGVVACRHVSLDFRAGEIHALLGENGAGKSTLVKMLGGVITPDEGRIELEGRPARLGNPRASRAAGIGVVHQAGSLIESMTVGENLALAGVAADAGTDGAVAIPADRPVRGLSPRERRLLEIDRLLRGRVRVLVLDEPTASLSPQESEAIFARLRTLARSGLAVVVVTHKLPEVLAHADRLTVLRGGRVVGHMTRPEMEPSRLVSWLTGGSAPADVDGRAPLAPAAGPAVLSLRGVATRRAGPHESPLEGIDLDLRRGEVVGLVGRPGSGITTLTALLAGRPAAFVAGRVERAAGAEAWRVGLIPAGGRAEGVVGTFSVAENLALRRRRLLGGLPGLGTWRRRSGFAEGLIRRFDIRPAEPRARLDALSGGNAQKVLVARELDFADTLLVAVGPTLGLDLAAAAQVRRLLRLKAADRACVVVVSDDLDELAEVADRVVVLSGGRLAGEVARPGLSPEAIGLALAEVPVPRASATLEREAGGATTLCVS